MVVNTAPDSRSPLLEDAMSRTVFAFVVLVAAVGVGAIKTGCDKAPPPAPTAAAPPHPPTPPAPVAAAPAKPKMVANPDGLNLADRIAKRQAEEKKLADQLAGEEKARLL